VTGSTKGPKRPMGGQNSKAVSKFHHSKTCNTCGESKRLADFAIIRRKLRAANPKRYSNKCKECTRAPSAATTDPNFKPDRKRRRKRKVGVSLEEARKTKRDYQRRARRATRIKCLEYLAEKGCCKCGNRDPRVLEFDHLSRRAKAKAIATLLSSGYSWASEKLRTEIRKCRVICANCHRLHTVVQREYYAHEDVQSVLTRLLEEHGIDE